ncbi:EF-hand domain-containing protein 1 [Caerostris extrusa]|uniref:EF-hand domain-containing protein 1 n=1 Tax=Caerostris extrusa TaxID=172846 RepID=A0AAV4QUZ0_CAEEX|nr:EF-hand domain-containing protein 1 [Caerostris extrusa]
MFIYLQLPQIATKYREQLTRLAQLTRFTHASWPTQLDTARETERIRKFVISFFMEDDTLKIHEEPVRNTGFDGGTFLARCRLKKGTRRGKEVFYEAQDLYVGAKLEASGHTFVITDADLLALKFMDNHPEIYTDINVEDQKKLINIAKGKKEMTQ